MRLFRFSFVLAAVILAGCCEKADSPATEAPVRVLIVDGFSNHDWARTTALIRGILETGGGFTVSVSTCPTPGGTAAWNAWPPDFSHADVVIQNCNDYGNGNRWSEPVRKELESFVSHGGGLFAFHSANNAFADWPEYDRMVGLLWRKKDYGKALTLDEQGGITVIPPGEGEGTSHGERVDALYTRRGSHPIHEGLPRRWLMADVEVYSYARGPAENVEVLSYAYDKYTGMRWPTEWTTAYGDGRVYSSTYGHVWKNQSDPVGMRCAGVRTLVPRVVRWLAKRPVDKAVPADFPTETKTSLRTL